jgi:hypothetical protein
MNDEYNEEVEQHDLMVKELLDALWLFKERLTREDKDAISTPAMGALLLTIEKANDLDYGRSW